MNDLLDRTEDRAELSGADELTIRRRLPGSVDRVWQYLVDADLRKTWLADGAMRLEPGAAFELVWHNDELTTPPGTRPPGFDAENRMASRIVACEPPRRLVFTWGDGGAEVSIALEPAGDDTLLTLVHTRLPQGEVRLHVLAGWHAHLDILVDRVAGRTPQPFWDAWSRLRRGYASRQAA